MPRTRASVRKRNTRIILLLLFTVFVLAALSCVLMLRLTRTPEQDLTGVWRMRVDLTDHARTCANLWLRGAELGDRVDAGDSLPRVQVTVLLRLNADGSWSRQVDRPSYASAGDEAVLALSRSLLELLDIRARASGRAVLGAEAAEARVLQALGMSSREYLLQAGPSLLPAYEELESLYNGGGSYRVTGESILFDGRRRAGFLTDGELLILKHDGETEVYERA